MKKIREDINQFFNTAKWVFGLYFTNYPRLTVIYISCQIMFGLEKLVNAYIVGKVTDRAIDIYTTGLTDISSLTPIIGMIIGFQLFFGFVNTTNNYASRMIDRQDWWRLKDILQKRLYKLGVPQLENPEISNKTQRFTEEIQNVLLFFQTSVGIIAGVITFLSATSILIFKIPLIVPIFSILLIIQWLINQNYLRKLWLFSRNSTEDRRKAISHSNSLVNSNDLKELIITNGYQYLEKKYEDFMEWFIAGTRKIRISWTLAMYGNRVADAFGFGLGLFFVLKRLVARLISVGELTFEFRSLRIFADAFNSLGNNFVSIKEMSIRLNDSRELFFECEPDIDGDIKLPSKNVPEINLENISFSYPNSAKNILQNFNLIIKPGEKIAIIGENGAGKTTLVKLLCRLYRVNEGNVKIAGININLLKIKSWYKNLGVLFQDYNTYPEMTVAENIQIGDVSKKIVEADVLDALDKANALSFVKQYPKKLEQILSEKYKGGIRPSTGQWQKIAIARFFYRNSPVLILDEPTASIDAVAEAQIFDNIYKFIKDKTVIIISHRFSTVRNADRIIVLDKGRIIESGSHEELLTKNGKYAKAFNLQAKGYV